MKPAPDARQKAVRIVALGGGTGLSTLLRGLKRHIARRKEDRVRRPIADLAAVVTVTDDGGSSGRLRRDYRILPPGDIRNCMVALSKDETLLRSLFQYRFSAGRGLRGHSFGNLFLIALSHITGDFVEAVRLAGQVLAIRGRIFPSTTQKVTLEAEMGDGRIVGGETAIAKAGKRAAIRRIRLKPRRVRPYPDVLEAIRLTTSAVCCLMCIISYGINLWLFFLTWIVRRRFRTGSFVVSFRQCLEYLASNQRWVFGAVLPFLLTVALTLTFFPQYWNLEGTVVMTDIPNGVSEEGDPWIGAANPSLEIIEFADYQCFQCRKMHFYLRQLIIQHPGKIRLIHRTYPMDDKVNPVVKEPFHIGSGALAMLAIYASSKGKFWEMNDVLYELAGKTERINVASVASLVGLDAHEIGAGIRSPNVLAKLRKDIQAGLQLGIVGTPAYLVDEKLSFGMIPSEYLSIVFE